MGDTESPIVHPPPAEAVTEHDRDESADVECDDPEVDEEDDVGQKLVGHCSTRAGSSMVQNVAEGVWPNPMEGNIEMGQMTFYHVCSASMSPCHLTREARDQAERSWLCSGCKSPKPGVEAVEVTLEAAPSVGSPLSFVSCGRRRASAEGFSPSAWLGLRMAQDDKGQSFIAWAELYRCSSN